MKRVRITPIVILLVGFAGCLLSGCADENMTSGNNPVFLPDDAYQCDVSPTNAAAPFTGAFKSEEQWQDIYNDDQPDATPDTYLTIWFLCLQQVGPALTGTLEQIFYTNNDLTMYKKYYGISADILPSGEEAMFHQNLITSKDGAFWYYWYEQKGMFNGNQTILQMCRTEPNMINRCTDYFRQ